MSLARRCGVVLVMAAVAVLAAGNLWAQEEGNGGARKPRAARPNRERPAGQANKPARKPMVRLNSGTSLDQALAKLELTDEQKTAAAEALKGWKEKQAEVAKANAEKRKALAAQIKEEKDAAKKAELQKQMKELGGGMQESGTARYESAKAAVKDALPAEQFDKLDGLAKEAQTEAAMKGFNGMVESFTKKGVELTDEQKGQVEAAKTKLSDELAKLAAGDSGKARSLSQAAVGEIKKSLTDEQKAKLAPAKREGGGREGGERRQGGQKRQPANEGNGEAGGDAPAGGDDAGAW